MSVPFRKKLFKKLLNQKYREAYAEESVKTSLPFQIRAIREKRGWSQARLGRESGMKQNAISRLESAEYGNLAVNTLLRLANAFGCALLVKFVPFSRLLREFEDVSPAALGVVQFEDDSKALLSWSLKPPVDQAVRTATIEAQTLPLFDLPERGSQTHTIEGRALATVAGADWTSIETPAYSQHTQDFTGNALLM